MEHQKFKYTLFSGRSIYFITFLINLAVTNERNVSGAQLSSDKVLCCHQVSVAVLAIVIENLRLFFSENSYNYVKMYEMTS